LKLLQHKDELMSFTSNTAITFT